MGTSVRTLIRNAFVAVVSDPIAVPSIAGRVKKQRSHVIPEDEMALGEWLVVRSGDEELSSLFGSAPRDQEMRMAIDVVAIARDVDDVDALIDQIVLEVRKAVFSDRTAGGNAKDIQYQGIADYGEDEENLDNVAAPMRFVATYATPENEPDTAL
jgi:hypothetical protein